MSHIPAATATTTATIDCLLLLIKKTDAKTNS